MFAKQYSITEVRNLLNESEGRGPGTGGHAMSTHGHLRNDVTDRNKPNNSAFQKEVRVFGKRLAKPGVSTKVSQPVPPLDLAMVVAFALNSDKGQQKLRELGAAQPGTQKTLVTEMKAIGNVLPNLRIGHGTAKSSGTLPRIHIDMFNLGGALHIHTAYACA